MGKWLSVKELFYGQRSSKKNLMDHSRIRTTEAYLDITGDRKVGAIMSLQFGV